MATVLDPRATVWYLTAPKKLSPAALQAVRGATHAGEPLYVPSITIVEVVYLVERGRLPAAAFTKLREALDSAESALTVVPLDSGVAEAVRRVSRELVPDMPDRIIAATALHLGLPLVTRDQRIRASGIEVIW